MDPVIMVPGLGSDATVWARTIKELGPDYKCRVGDTLSDASLTGMAKRVLDDAPDRFALAGVSMGGMVAVTIMRLAPERVTRLALFDTNARADTPEQAARRRSSNAAMLAATDLRALAGPGVAYMVHPRTGQNVRDALASMTVRVGAAVYVRQNEAVAARDDLFPVLAGIAVPTIVAVGADDLMTPVAFSRALADAIAGAELHVIPECGHLPPIEKPAATANLIRAWLRPPLAAIIHQPEAILCWGGLFSRDGCASVRVRCHLGSDMRSARCGGVRGWWKWVTAGYAAPPFS